MTEHRLYEILRENGYDEISSDGELMTSMKQAVNEAIDECAEAADWGIHQNDDGEEPFHHENNIFADTRRILSLKVK